MLVMMMMLMMMTMQISRPLGHMMLRAALKKKMLMTTMIMSRPPGHMMPTAEYDDNDVGYRQQ